VRENLNVAARHPSVLASVAEVLGRPVGNTEAVNSALDALSLGPLADAVPSELTQGQRKLVAVARALAAQPKLLCLDEPAAGLDGSESAELGRRLRQIVDDGTPVLLVDHDMGLVLGICDQLVVLEFGTVIARGTPAEIRVNPAVVEAYLGSAALPQLLTAIDTPASSTTTETSADAH
jgi:branched-chain amino acid transport system ATP-binding protein